MHVYFIDIDDCSTNPCGDNGACQDGVATYNCTCVDGYAGVNCETGRVEWGRERVRIALGWGNYHVKDTVRINHTFSSFSV
jgi:hypothetical protein